MKKRILAVLVIVMMVMCACSDGITKQKVDADEKLLESTIVLIILSVAGTIISIYMGIQFKKQTINRAIEKNEKMKENAKMEEEYNARHAEIAKGTASPTIKYQEPCSSDMTLPKADEWKCYQCARINPNGILFCKCGMKKAESRRLFNLYEEREKKIETAKLRHEELKKQNASCASLDASQSRDIHINEKQASQNKPDDK